MKRQVLVVSLLSFIFMMLPVGLEAAEDGVDVVESTEIQPTAPKEVKDFDGLMDLPPLPEEIELWQDEASFGYRGRIGVFQLPPSRVGIFFDKKVNFYSGEDEIWPKGKSLRIRYDKEGDTSRSFCGAYFILLADISEYKLMSFMIKGQTGQESFEVGMNDVISNRREDAVIVGPIHRYLAQGLTGEWQKVTIPLPDFYGPNLGSVYSVVFHFNEEGQGVIWMDDFKFYKKGFVDRESEITERGYLLLDNFDHANIVNLLGRKTNTYKKLPSVAKHKFDKKVFCGNKGRSLKLDYSKVARGWCGYYSLLNQIDGAYYDLTGYKSLSFMVRGKEGGETFEIGMADKNWVIIGDSIKAGTIDQYLPKGVTTEWQEVIIPLKDFGGLDFGEMGSFVINFHKQQVGTIYVDDVKFYLKTEEDEGTDAWDNW